MKYLPPAGEVPTNRLGVTAMPDDRCDETSVYTAGGSGVFLAVLLFFMFGAFCAR